MGSVRLLNPYEGGAWRIIVTVFFYLEGARSGIMAVDCPFLLRCVFISGGTFARAFVVFFAGR